MKVAVLLLGPLAILVLAALAIFGTTGPAADDIRGQATFRLLGMSYGIYLIALSYVWSKRKSRGERR
jgi:hypothetical protein